MNTTGYTAQVHTQDKRCKTGCIGVNFTIIREKRAGGHVARAFFQASVGYARRRFPLATLGKEEAFRRAVQARAAYEQSVKLEKEVTHA